MWRNIIKDEKKPHNFGVYNGAATNFFPLSINLIIFTINKNQKFNLQISFVQPPVQNPINLY